MPGRIPSSKLSKQAPAKGVGKRKKRGAYGWLPNSLRRAGRRFRERSGRCQLEPLANVSRTGGGQFCAESNDPQLAIRPVSRRLPIGWVQLDLRTASAPAYPFSPQIFFDRGKGWNEADSLRLPAPRKGRTLAFFRLPANVKRLRLDVGETSGPFCIQSLRMWETSAAEAWLMHLGRAGVGLASSHPSHPWDRRGVLVRALRQRIRSILGQSESAPAVDHPVENKEFVGRQPRLDLYRSETNEVRAQGARSMRERVRAGGTEPGLSIIILNLDKPELIIPLLDRLDEERKAFAATGLRLQVLIGDTGSTDSRVLSRYEASSPDFIIERNLRYHFSRNNNVLSTRASCDTLLFLNNDVIFPANRNALLEMHRHLHAQVTRGIVGCCLYYEDGLVQHVGVDFLRDATVRGLCFHPRARTRLDPTSLQEAWPVPAVTGACLMIRAGLFAAVGGMDENYSAECQDIALCLSAARLGYETLIANCGPVLHIENATRPKGEENWPDRQRFLRRWGAYIEACYL